MIATLFNKFLEENGLVARPGAVLIADEDSVHYEVDGAFIDIHEGWRGYWLEISIYPEYGPCTPDEAYDALNNVEEGIRFMFDTVYGMQQISHTRTC